MSEQIEDDGVDLTISIGFVKGMVVQRVTVRGVEAPSSFIDIVTDPDSPNAFHEFQQVTQILTTDFIRLMEEGMAHRIQQDMGGAPDEVIDAVAEEVADGLALQGFSTEMIDGLADEMRGKIRGE